MRILTAQVAGTLPQAETTLKESRQFMKAQQEAEPLFGPEFNQVAKRLDETLSAYSFEQADLAKKGGGRDWQDVARLGRLTANIIALQKQLASDAAPYVTVGTRGLGLFQRIRIRAIAARRAYYRRKGRWFASDP